MNATATIRALRPEDIGRLSGVLSRAYGSDQPFERRLLSYLSMRRVATFIAESGGVPVGMVVGNDYGRVAYVSQMAVDPPLHRRGIGTLLMDALVAWVEAGAFEATELDATPAGAPLYERYEFVPTDRTDVYLATSTGFSESAETAVRIAKPADRPAILALDALAFGADRSEVLELLFDTAPQAVFVAGPAREISGYAIAQAGSQLLGPVVAGDAATAAALVEAAAAGLSAGHRLSISSVNPAARQVATQRGYRFARSLAHMVRGARPPAQRARIFARINLGQG